MSPQLLVVDIAASIAFYTNKIGFDLEFHYEDFYAGVSKNGHSIHLKSGKPLLEERQNKLANDDLDIVFSIEAVEDLYKDFAKNPYKLRSHCATDHTAKNFTLLTLTDIFLRF